MGDVAMTAPVVAELLASHPDTKVVMLTRGFFAPFFTESDRFEIFNIELHGRHAGVKGLYKLYKELSSAYKIDVVADLHSKLYSKVLCLFFKATGTKCHKIDKGRGGKRALTRDKNKSLVQLKTNIERYADVFATAGMPLVVDTALKHQERPIPAQFGTKSGRWIGISPFAQHRGKMLPIETIEEVIKGLMTDRVFVFGGGDSEKQVAEELEAKYANVTSVIGKIRLKEEMDMIANLDVMVTMDSSAMHIASLVGVRAVSIWGATHPYAGFLGMGQSPADVVQIDSLECRPCSVYGNKPCKRGDYACLSSIKAEDILSQI